MINPLGDRIVVRRDEAPEKSKGGIIIPADAADPPWTAEVVAVGPGPRLPDGTRDPMGINVGDRVLISKGAGQQIKIDDDDELLVIEEKHLLGTLMKAADESSEATA